MIHPCATLSIVIVAYRRPDLLWRCLESIELHPPSEPWETIVVDNDPGSGTADLVEQRFPWAILLRSDTNQGFSRAANLGTSAASGEHLLFLNPDAFVHRGAVDRLLRAAREDPHRGLLGGLILTGTGDTDRTSVWAAPTLWSGVCFALGLSSLFRRARLFNPEAMPDWGRDNIRAVDVITGCFLLATRSAWQRLGGFDEGFWLYGEDADLCLRARRIGYRPTFIPDAVATHLGSSSSGGRQDVVLLMRAKAQLMHKHWPPKRARAGVALLELGTGVRALGTRMAAASDPSRRESADAWARGWRHRRWWRARWFPEGPVPSSSSDVRR